MYKVLVSTCPFDKDKLNDMYYQGWEFITVVYGRGQYGNGEYTHYFKRMIIAKNQIEDEGNEIRVPQS